MMNRVTTRTAFIFSLLFLIVFGSLPLAKAGNKENVKLVTVTVKHKSNNSLPTLSKDDFIVSEDGEQREVIAAVPADSKKAPLNLAIVLQEDLPQVNNEIKTLQRFVQTLPSGSQVMVVYLQGNFVNIAQPFTSELNRAAKKLRVVNGSAFNGPSSPYLGLIDVMKKFNGQSMGRNEILLVSNGIDSLDANPSPTQSMHLDRAIRIAQQQNITVFSIHSPAAQQRVSFRNFQGQGALNHLSEQTGGKAFAMGSGFVGFDAPLAELQQSLNQQYVIAYKTNSNDKGFRRVKVSTDYSNIKVEAAKGYKAQS